MTKKDYEIIAGVIARHREQVSLDFVRDLALSLQADNPEFDISKFTDACYPEVETESGG